MKFWKETKRFFSEVNKKIVERSPIASVPPFNKVKDDGRNHVGVKREKSPGE